MTEIIVIMIYLSFCLDFLLWPVSSEVSTIAMVTHTKSVLPLRSVLLILCNLGILILWLSPLWHVISAHWLSVPDTPTELVWTGLILAIGGRLITIRASYLLKNQGVATLNTRSVFAYSRHPIVTGLHMTLSGLLLYSAAALLWIPFLGSLLYFDYKIRLEEKNLAEIFGTAYADYTATTPRYLPWHW